MTDRRDNKKNLNKKRPQTRETYSKNESLVSSRQNESQRSNRNSNHINRNSVSKNIKQNDNNSQRSQSKQLHKQSNNQNNKNFFFNSNKNIHNDVKTAYKKKRKPEKRKNIRFNNPGVIIISVMILGLFVYYAIALFDAQVLKSNEMTEKANSQYYSKTSLPSKRGDIYDRNGKLLATTTNVFRIGITPKHVYSSYESQSKDEIANTMASILKINEDELKEELAKTDESYIQIANKISQEQASLLDQYLEINNIGGVRLDAEPQRVYYNDDVASQVIGFASSDENGLQGRLGIEYQLDDVLSGKTGYLFAAKDNYLNSGTLPFTQSTELDTENGNNVYLTIDYDISKELQEHVQSAAGSLGARDGGMGIVLNVKTGEVLAMASYPYFSSSDPTAKPDDWDDESPFKPETQDTIDLLMKNYWTNKVISYLYEVGSTFKTITLSMGLEENIASEEKIYSDQPIQVLDYTIKSWTDDNLFGELTLQDAFLYSLNPPFVQVALDLGIDTFYSYVEALGLKQQSGVELPGEIDNIFHENPTEIDLATLAFGEQSSMNLMSYSKALSAIVNGGNLIKPTIIKQISNDQNAIIESSETQIERRVISEKTSERVNKLLARNDSLQGYNRVSGGYELGGKTSTSVNEATDALTISYASFAPINDPEIMVLIVALDSDAPDVGSDSLISNVSSIMDFTLDHLNVERNYTDEQLETMEEKVALPELNGFSLEEAMNALNYQSINVVSGVDNMKLEDTIISMIPAAGTEVHYGSNVYVYPNLNIEQDLVSVPDFTGKNFNECMIAANSAGVTCIFEGDMSGLAVSQSILYDYSVITINDDQTEDNQVSIDNETTDIDNDLSLVQRGSTINIVLESVSAD